MSGRAVVPPRPTARRGRTIRPGMGQDRAAHRWSVWLMHKPHHQGQPHHDAKDVSGRSKGHSKPQIHKEGGKTPTPESCGCLH